VYETAERITKSHPIGSERFWSVCTDNFEMRNLYAKNIMFACSLPTSTSTWRSEHRNGPGGYMSGELKSENIKYRKTPTRRSHHPAKDPQLSHHIQPSPRKILVLYTILERPSRPTTKTLLDQQDPHGLLFTLECNYNRRPPTLPEISRRV
jgi:hypothetical protein